MLAPDLGVQRWAEVIPSFPMQLFCFVLYLLQVSSHAPELVSFVISSKLSLCFSEPLTYYSAAALVRERGHTTRIVCCVFPLAIYF